ncbi:MAG: cytochrome c [Gammaproteobacteria bacterium]|nr:cytochrome c [Gammaproteobacteria bacterium]
MTPLKFLAITATSLLLVAIIVLAIFASYSPRDQVFDVNPDPVPIPDDADALARGWYMAHAVGVCGVCHGPDLAGQTMSESVIWGYITTPNLTPGEGGIGGEYTVVDWVRAVRHGVGREGNPFAFMPVDHYFHMTDEDLGDMIAYLKSLPAVDNEGARMDLGIIPRIIINSGIKGDLVRAEKMDHTRPRPEPAASRAEYLVTLGGCDFCHGPTLTGGQGPEPGAPPGPDLTSSSAMAQWPLEDFEQVMRTGTLPTGEVINPFFMPWQGYQHLSDEDLALMFDYLRALPGRTD